MVRSVWQAANGLSQEGYECLLPNTHLVQGLILSENQPGEILDVSWVLHITPRHISYCRKKNTNLPSYQELSGNQEEGCPSGCASNRLSLDRRLK